MIELWIDMWKYSTIQKEDFSMSRAKQSMDGNTAAAHVAYAFEPK